MSWYGDVNWCEGLFLQPHHLQVMQRTLRREAERTCSLLRPHGYGVLEMRVSGEELAAKRVRIERLRVVLPSGLVVDHPGDFELPVLDIRDAFDRSEQGVTVCLGVPMWSEREGNCLVEGQTSGGWSKRRYAVREQEMPDENTGGNPQNIPLRYLNARLILAEDDCDNLELLPILRVIPGAGDAEGTPVADPRFMPACFALKGCSALFDLVRNLASLVDANAEEVLSKLQSANFRLSTATSAQLEQFLRYQTLSRCGASLGALAQTPGASPFEAYRELCVLASELGSFALDEPRHRCPAYDHDHPAIPFLALETRIRAMLRTVIAPRFIRLDFVWVDGALQVELNDEHLTRPDAYFLALNSRRSPAELVQLLETGDAFKLMAPSLAESKAIRGVPLQVEHAPPYVLPLKTGCHYFRLSPGTRDEMWKAVKRDKGMQVVAKGDLSDIEVSLYMTLPDSGEGE